MAQTASLSARGRLPFLEQNRIEEGEEVCRGKGEGVWEWRREAEGVRARADRVRAEVTSKRGLLHDIVICSSGRRGRSEQVNILIGVSVPGISPTPPCLQCYVWTVARYVLGLGLRCIKCSQLMEALARLCEATEPEEAWTEATDVWCMKALCRIVIY